MEHSLYSIKEEYIKLLQLVEENSGELSPQLEKALSINYSELKEKSLNYVQLLIELQSKIDLGKQEIERAKKYIAQKERLCNLLEERLIDAVKTFGKIKTGTFEISTRKSEQVIITDIDLLPNKYKKIKQEIVPDKKLIKEGIKEAEKKKNSFAGAFIVEKDNLQY